MGMGTNPGMGMGTNPGMGMGMATNPMNSGMAMNMGMNTTGPAVPPRPHAHYGYNCSWVPPPPASAPPPPIGIERGTTLLTGIGFELKAGALSTWMACDAYLTTDYVQFTYENSKNSVMLLLLNIHEIRESDLSLRIISANPDPVTGSDEVHTLRISDPKVRSEWKLALEKWTRHAANNETPFSGYLRNANAMAFVGGSEYFPVLADTLLKAREEVLIADWWLTPEIYLKRNPIDDKWRLDKILMLLAENGVQVKILVYCEMPATVELGSERVTKFFTHKNIKAMRMPFRFAGANVNTDYMF